MWRSSCMFLLKQSSKSGVRFKPRLLLGLRSCLDEYRACFCGVESAAFLSSESIYGGGEKEKEKEKEGDAMSFSEAKKLMRLVNVDSLKMKLGSEGKEVIKYSELLDACQRMGVAKTPDEAAAFARVLDEAGVVLLFRDKVYLHPDKVVDMVRKAVPLALTFEDDPRREELQNLYAKKEEIDTLAHKQVRRILWAGLGMSMLGVGLFFRLTFWEFSWDVMEPIAFFTTTTGIVVGYGYFLITSRDPTYQDFMERLFLSRQRKLMKRNGFNLDRFVELQKKCKSSPVSKLLTGIQLEPVNLLHRN